LAAEIHRDLPEFTVHDITHLDALWEIADIVAGEQFSLTPPEAFVLGGAFLLHDLGMSLAAYPQGETRFPRTLGAPHWCPKEWTLDPLKLACLLRLADAGHIDARRAPYFLRAIRHISAASADHWSFQQRIGKPHLSGDALCYTSGYAFPFEECASWWLCFDTLRMIDEELRVVDALLSDKGMNRFAARRVAGIESPERLTSYVPTAGWTPVDASVQVSDVPRLLTCLGGKELYGRDMTVPLRELIQNASDALRARCAIEGRPEGWGQVSVRLGADGNKAWLEVEDNGIGMSPTVLTKYLLDFSTTFWGSSAMIDELPGLLGSGFRATGKYGIGFFSVFMLGDSVIIRTRRADAAQKDTLVLEFNTGLSARPVLRQAANTEVLRDGGSCIRVWLRTAPTGYGGLLYRFNDDPPISLAQRCRELCPALPVTLVSHENDVTTPVITGGDWLDCPGEELLRRVFSETHDTAKHPDRRVFITKAAANLRVLRERDGTAVGRACIAIGVGTGRTLGRRAGIGGAVTIGGLKSTRLQGIVGVLTGTSERAARDMAMPVVSPETLSAWATEQASLVPAL
jgi:hypothetical protein